MLFGSVAVAVENVENDLYGAVNAPIEIAILGGVLAILLALLPFALRRNEEEFVKMKEHDQATFGKPHKDEFSTRET
jgi:hypothetical protein